MIKQNNDELRETSRRMRIEILKMLNRAASGHTGGSLSAADIMTALYFRIMNHDPRKPSWPARDRFVLSKGHGAPALYTALAFSGYFGISELATLRQAGSVLQGHPDMRKTRGTDASSGSLGQGLSIANGLALGLRLDGNSANVYVMLGDGELQEGQVWEAAMSAAHYRLGKVIAIVDKNGLQIDGEVKKVMGVEPVDAKWRAFGWDVTEIDGHDFSQIVPALESPRGKGLVDKPTVIIARTVKGKGVSFFENQARYHGVAPSNDELQRALKELGG